MCHAERLALLLGWEAGVTHPCRDLLVLIGGCRRAWNATTRCTASVLTRW